MTTRQTAARPTVTVAIPVLNEERYIDECLDAIGRQTYGSIVEVLVVDGGSTDATRGLVSARSGVTLLDNPRRIQAAALNIALQAAQGEIFVRVDGHCTIAHDYVERCVEALEATEAAMVGGPMTPTAVAGTFGAVIAMAMRSPLGAGPARFHVGGEAGWVDTVYLGAFRAEVALAVGGYAEDVGVNEDAELAIRMGEYGGVWFEPSIRSAYVPRGSMLAIARQFYRYGRSRAATVRRHPDSFAPRQVAPVALLAGLISPWRRTIAACYAVALGVAAFDAVRRDLDTSAIPQFVVVLPVMHLTWACGFVVGSVRPR